MSSPARALKPRRLQGQIHLPSVHVRSKDGYSGFDYNEDICVRGAGRSRLAERTVRLVAFENGNEPLIRETIDVLCEEELAELESSIDFFMDQTNPELIALMETRGREEFARQRRIAAGQEQVCSSCGCSESRACSGGCVWATKAMCSRCV